MAEVSDKTKREVARDWKLKHLVIFCILYYIFVICGLGLVLIWNNELLGLLEKALYNYRGYE